MKKLLVMLLVFAMLLSVMVGCGKSEEAPAPEAEVSEPVEDTADVQEESSPEEAPEEDAVEEAPAYAQVDYELPLFDEQPEFTVFYPLRQGGGGGSMPARDGGDFPFWQRLQENLNVDLIFREPADSVCTEQYNLMVASGDVTDLVFESMLSSNASAYPGGYDKAIQDEVYLDLIDYMEYAPNYAYFALGNDDNRKVVLTDEGHIGAFMKVLSEPEKTNIGLTVHEQYLIDTGLEMPSTVSEWMTVFEAMHNNGVKYPCAVTSSAQIQDGEFTAAMGACIDTSFLIDAQSGELVFGPTTPETKEYIEVFIECVDNGWVDPDWAYNTYMENPLFVDGSIATCSQLGQRLVPLSQQYGFDLVPCPTVHREGYEEGQLAIGEVAYPLISSGGGIAVASSCADIENAMKLIDWMYSPAGAELCNFGWIEGETYYVEDGQKYINDFFQATNEVYNFGNKTLYSSDRDFGYVFPNSSYYVAVGIQKEANDLWTVKTDNAAAIYLNLPGSVRLNSQESEELTTLINDLDTYVQSTLYGWLCKTAPFSDEAWEEFVAGCRNMNLDEIRAGYEAAYGRYLEK